MSLSRESWQTLATANTKHLSQITHDKNILIKTKTKCLLIHLVCQYCFIFAKYCHYVIYLTLWINKVGRSQEKGINEKVVYSLAGGRSISSFLEIYWKLSASKLCEAAVPDQDLVQTGLTTEWYQTPSFLPIIQLANFTNMKILYSQARIHFDRDLQI